MREIQERIASVAFPASATVVLAVYAFQGATGVNVPPEASAAATGLVTWLAVVFLGSRQKQ